MDVVGRIGGLSVVLPPSHDALVHGIGMNATAALGQVRFSVEGVDGDVVGGVLLGGVVADGATVSRVVAERELQRANAHCSVTRRVGGSVQAVALWFDQSVGVGSFVDLEHGGER